MFFLPQNRELLGEINVEMCIIEKSKKILSKKNCKLVFFETVKRTKIAHDKIQWMKNVVHYLNMKIPDILVEIIDLQLLFHSNDMKFIKRGSIGLDPVFYT